jgi:hypothetical protein
MKKKLLAIGVASALGLGAGAVNAMGVAENGIGMYNILPYYSVQNGNATVISITNTDIVNGKAVKVRFRGAEWSDDVFDFTLFLSPGDVWTGAVYANGDVAAMETSDKSCTLPLNINQDFITFRLQKSEDADAGTREGYVEIITMADIPPVAFDDADSTTYLYKAIKHVNGVAPCDGDLGDGVSGALSDLEEDTPSVATAQGMEIPTGSLMSYATIINVPTSKAFTAPGVALNPQGGNPNGAQNKIYFTQKNVALPWGRDGVAALTADLIFAPRNLLADVFGGTADIGGTALPMFQFDMPDLTTPVQGPWGGAGDAIAQRDDVTDALRRANAVVEYLTDDSLLATTDVVFNQPTRRFYYWFDQRADADDRKYTIDGQKYDVIGEDANLSPGPFGTTYASLDGDNNLIAVNFPDFWDQEEDNFDEPSNIVISPTPPGELVQFFLVGEAAVVSINNGNLPTGSLQAELTAYNYDSPLDGANGWVNLNTTTDLDGDGETLFDGEPLPVIGFTAIKVFNGAVGAAGTNYGMTLPLRTPETP